MSPMLLVHVGGGMLLIAVSIPLILRIVPRNHVYGVRIPKAFESDQNWYAVNAYGGKLLLIFGCLLVAYGVFMRPYAPDPKSMLSLVYVLAPLSILPVVLAMIFAFARRLP